MLLNWSILKSREEGRVDGREVGGKGVTYNALLAPARGRAGSESAIIFEVHWSAQNQYFQQMRLTKKHL